MSENAPPRRRRVASSRATAPVPAAPAPAIAAEPDGRAPRRRLNLPLLPILAGTLGLALLATAWTTRWPPGPPAEADQATRFTLEIPANRQNVINSWETFFVCYDLLDPAIVELTLRANQRATGSVDFPREKVVVELPSAAGTANRAAPSSAEEELVQLRRSILDARAERLGAIQRQCAA